MIFSDYDTAGNPAVYKPKRNPLDDMLGARVGVPVIPDAGYQVEKMVAPGARMGMPVQSDSYRFDGYIDPPAQATEYYGMAPALMGQAPDRSAAMNMFAKANMGGMYPKATPVPQEPNVAAKYPELANYISPPQYQASIPNMGPQMQTGPRLDDGGNLNAAFIAKGGVPGMGIQPTYQQMVADIINDQKTYAPGGFRTPGFAVGRAGGLSNFTRSDPYDYGLAMRGAEGVLQNEMNDSRLANQQALAHITGQYDTQRAQIMADAQLGKTNVPTFKDLKDSYSFSPTLAEAEIDQMVKAGRISPEIAENIRLENLFDPAKRLGVGSRGFFASLAANYNPTKLPIGRVKAELAKLGVTPEAIQKTGISGMVPWSLNAPIPGMDFSFSPESYIRSGSAPASHIAQYNLMKQLLGQ